MPELDRKVTEIFAGKVVRKDLVRQVKVGANVPTYVLEYLLGKYCATDDPVAVEAGLRLAHNNLADHIIRPDEAMKAQSESILTAFDFIKANKTRLGIERDIDSYDFHVQIVT